MNLIAVKDCTLSLSQGTGTITIQTPPSTKSKIDNKGIYAGNLTILITNYVGATITNGTGSGTLFPLSQKVKVENKIVCVEGDKTQITVTGVTVSGSPSSEIVTVTISKAGQNKIKAA